MQHYVYVYSYVLQRGYASYFYVISARWCVLCKLLAGKRCVSCKLRQPEAIENRALKITRQSKCSKRQQKQGESRLRSSQAMPRPILVKYFEALVNRFCDCNVSWKIFNILGRYWILASLQGSVGNSHILLGVPNERIDISLRILTNGMVYDLG